MFWAKQSNGFRAWFGVKQDDGELRTGLINGDFTITVRSPNDSDGYTAIVTESAKTGFYHFDVASSFVTTNGVGEYGVLIEVDTKAGPGGAPNVVDVMSEVLKVNQEDFDSLAAAVWDVPIADHDAYGTFGRAVGFGVSAESTVTGGTATTIQTGLIEPNGFWDEHQVIVSDLSGGQKVIRNISTYVQANGAITFNTVLPFTPAVNDPIMIFARSSAASATVDAYQIADAVWTTQASGYSNNDGSMGQVLGFTLAVNATINATVDGYTIQTTLTDANGFWDNHQAVIYDISTGKKVVRNITSYLQSSGTVTFSQTLPFTAVSGDLLMVINRTPATGTATATVDNNAIATAVWAKSISTSSAEGTFGRAVGFTTAIETTVTGGTATTITTGLTQADSFWNDHQVIVFDAGSGEKVVRNITTYVNASGAITFNDPLPFTPAVSDPVLISTKSSSTTATASVDAYAVANAVWEETIASHLDILTFGGFLANQAGFGPLPPTTANVSTGSSRSFSGSGNASILLDAPINYITVSVQKESARLSVDGGQTFINLIAGIHSFRIGITRIVKIQSTQTWQFIGEKA